MVAWLQESVLAIRDFSQADRALQRVRTFRLLIHARRRPTSQLDQHHRLNVIHPSLSKLRATAFRYDFASAFAGH